MKQTLSLIEVRFQHHYTSGVVSDWSDWTSLYAFETKEDANNEVFKLRDQELKKFGAWSLETVHNQMFMIHDYRVVDLLVY